MSYAWASDLDKEKEFFDKSEPLKEEQYDHIDNDRLILYVVHYLERNNVEPTFEKIVVAAYRLFPKRFTLLGFPEHPDAKTVYYPIMHCSYRKKGWLSGNMKSAFHLTSNGRLVLDQMLTALDQKSSVPKTIQMLPSRKEKYFLDLLESSSAFRKYVAGKVEDVTEMEIRIMLRTRADTPSEVLKQNLNKYIGYAAVADRSELIEFLEYVKKSSKWSNLFR